MRAAKGERGIWQRRFWEYTIRDERDYAAHVDYVHINPVKHGLVACVRDWPYSSFHRCVAQGVYAPDKIAAIRRFPGVPMHTHAPTFIAELANRVFGDPAKASAWLDRPCMQLGGRTPRDVLGSEEGARRVEELLRQIDDDQRHGIG